MPAHVQLADEAACERYYDGRFQSGYMNNWPAARARRIAGLLRELALPVSGAAVDYGCGGGAFTAVLRHALPGWTITGIDLSRTGLEQARVRVPQARFLHLSDADIPPGSVDLLFSHHVLEHVRDLEPTWFRMTRLVSPQGRMLHILPCGNAGSFEHRLCRLRRDGIDLDTGLFFFEDEGHLRRLTTDAMTNLAGATGFRLEAAFYSHHEMESIDTLAGNGVRFVRNLCDPARAASPDARRELKAIRRRLLPIALAKSLARRGRTPGPLGKGCSVLARLFHRRLARLAARAETEWLERRTDPDGSEMYLVLARA
jgi:SAM-dependent methyltransferase